MKKCLTIVIIILKISWIRSEDRGIIMKQERLTIEEMERKYPDMWLFITHCEFSENTKLVAGVVSAYSKSRDEINDTSSKYEGGAAIRYTGSILDGRIYLL